MRLRTVVQKCLHFEREKRLENALTLLKSLSVVHKSITDRSPEQVMEKFMRSDSSDEKMLVIVKHKIRWKPLLVWSTIADACCGECCCVNAAYQLLSKNITSTTAVQKIEAVPANPPAAPVALQNTIAVQNEDNGKAAVPEVALQNSETATKKPDQELLPAPPEKSSKKRPQCLFRRPLRRLLRKKRLFRRLWPRQQGPFYGKNTSRTAAVIDQLTKDYGSADPLTLLTGEIDQGHFENARDIYRKLPGDQARSTAGQIYRMRILLGLREPSTVGQFFASADIQDAEFYLEKSKYLCENKKVTEAQAALDKAAHLPATLLAGSRLQEKNLYCKALYQSALFDQNPTADAKAAALAGWNSLKSNSPNSSGAKKADEEIARINGK